MRVTYVLPPTFYHSKPSTQIKKKKINKKLKKLFSKLHHQHHHQNCNFFKLKMVLKIKFNFKRFTNYKPF